MFYKWIFALIWVRSHLLFGFLGWDPGLALKYRNPQIQTKCCYNACFLEDLQILSGLQGPATS